MKKLDDQDLYLILKSSGTYHLAEAHQSYDSPYIIYKSLCGQSKKRIHQDERPVRKVESLDDIPTKHDNCQRCINMFKQHWKDVTVNIPLPKIVAVKIMAAYKNDTGLSKKEIEDMAKKIDENVSPLLLD
jgi:hypothetical protein